MPIIMIRLSLLVTMAERGELISRLSPFQGRELSHPKLLLPISTPNELDRRRDIRVKALFHWTGVRCVFEPLLILKARCPGNSNRDSQAIDSSWGCAALPQGRARMEPEGSTATRAHAASRAAAVSSRRITSLRFLRRVASGWAIFRAASMSPSRGASRP